MNFSGTPGYKSVAVFGFILFLALGVVFLTMKTTNTSGSSEDIRSHAANPADRVVDSNAMVDYTAQSVQSLNSDPSTAPTDTSNDAADIQEIKGL